MEPLRMASDFFLLLNWAVFIKVRMNAGWMSIPLVVMDFEGSPRSGVVEFGAVEMLGNEILHAETGLCRPVGEMSFLETDVHGLHQQELECHPLFEDHYSQFVEYRKRGIFAAHNAPVEHRFLESTWPTPPWVPAWGERSGDSIASWGPWVDSLGLYRNVYPQLESYSLMALIERFRLLEELIECSSKYCPKERSKPHCALYDALASAVLLRHLMNEDGFAEASLSWVLKHSRGSFVDQQELF